MSKLSATKFIVVTLILSFSVTICEAQSSKKPISPKPGNGLMAKPTGKKKAAKGPVSIKNAKKKADVKIKKRKKDFVKYVKENHKRSVEIQTPEVQARMKQNVKDANANYKAKKKRNTTRTRSAGRKYR